MEPSWSPGCNRWQPVASGAAAKSARTDENRCWIGREVACNGEESAALRRALQPVDEAFAPAGIERLPVELALSLRVRRAPALDHHRRQHLAGEELAQPVRHMTGRLRSDGVRGIWKPCRHRRRVVVDDVVDPSPPAFDRGEGRACSVLDVDEGGHATAVADEREGTLAD